ncbi:MAG: rhodanese-like domain-containing protein [Candidatus Dojkabacteria bacterium]|nr:MAG: rhodanese-like domain-containing protein [Candidatus Dojkabacteria bacterium]
MHEYIEELDESLFPKIQNPELLRALLQKGIETNVSPEMRAQTSAISVQAAFQLLFGGNSSRILNDGIGQSNEHIAIDVRKQSDFDKFRINGIKHVHIADIESADNLHLAPYRSKKVVVFDCGLSNGGSYAAGVLRGHGINAVYVKGGMDVWTKRKYPFIRPNESLQLGP